MVGAKQENFRNLEPPIRQKGPALFTARDQEFLSWFLIESN